MPDGTERQAEIVLGPPSVRAIVRVVLVIVGILAALYLIYLVRSVLGLFLIAVFFALAIAPAVNFLDNRRVPRSLAILLVYVSIAAGIFGIGLLVVPPLVDGVNNLSNDLPGYVDDLRHNKTFREYDNKYDITKKLQQQANDLPSKLGDAAGTLRDVTVNVFSRFVQLFSILVITFFLLMDGRRILEFGYRQLSPQHEARARSVASDISDAIAGYVFGNFVISVLAGLVTFVTLEAIGVPFAVPLAVLFAFFDLIPLIGATLGGILVGIVVAFVSFPGGLLVWAVVLIVYQQIENNMIQPVVYGRTVAIHPLVVIVAVLIGSALLGILGALVAIPGRGGAAERRARPLALPPRRPGRDGGGGRRGSLVQPERAGRDAADPDQARPDVGPEDRPDLG
jgi:predicted PurR-regulated permease PerM